MANFDVLTFAARLAVYFVPFLFALCFHEFSHGMVARMRGDNTALLMGRLTLNPMAHADMVGTFILPVMAILFSSPIFFGWAKPVPVNVRNLKNPKVDLFWIALAGPASNVFLAVCGAVAWAISVRSLGGTGYLTSVSNLLDVFIGINLFLAVFNLIPIHPLDGGKVIARFLPANINQMLEQNEMTLNLVLLFLMLSGALSILVIPVRIGHEWLKVLAMSLVGV